MGPLGLRLPILAAVLLLTPTLAIPSPRDTDLLESADDYLTSTWTFKPCIKLDGKITITGKDSSPTSHVAPTSADAVHICGYCDESESLLQLRWSNDKFLHFFFTREEGLIETFQLDQVQYVEGTKLYYSDIGGIRGAYNGRVGCRHDLVIPLKFDKEANATYHCESAGRAQKRGQSVIVATEPIGDGIPRGIVLQQFSVMYADNIDQLPLHETSCQKEPDLAIILGVSGVLSASILIGMAAAAMRLFS